jgi:hypothetical protein
MASGAKAADDMGGSTSESPEAWTLKNSHASSAAGAQPAAATTTATATIIDEPIDEPPPPRNWLVAWIMGQIHAFSFPMLLMAIKFTSLLH